MSGTGLRRLLVGTIAAGALVLPAASQGAVGDVFLADEDALPTMGDNGAIFKLGRTGGDATAIATGSGFSDPAGMILDRNGTLLVADRGSTTDVYRINRRTGAVSTFFSSADFDDVRDVALGPDGKVYVTDAGPNDGLYRINRRTKAVTTVASGPLFSFPWGLVISRDGKAYIGERNDDSILKVNLRTGQTTTLVSDAALFGSPEDLRLTPNERSIIVTDSVSDQLVRVNRRTGAASAFAAVLSVRGVGLLSSSAFLASDVFNDDLVRVGKSGTPVTSFSTDPDIAWPHDIVIEPAKCGGKWPTVVGTKGRDVIRGSRFADVISTLGGRDTVRAGKGRDIVCGGKGRDRLIGGKGRDRLIGGPGRDLQRQ